jgi:hypothetical protein
MVASVARASTDTKRNIQLDKHTIVSNQEHVVAVSSKQKHGGGYTVAYTKIYVL